MTPERGLPERALINCMLHSPDREVVAVGIIETRAAVRLVDDGIATIVAESSRSVDRWGAGSMRLRLKDGAS